MSARKSLKVLVRLNELALLDGRVEAARALQALRSAEALVRRQEQNVAHAASKYAVAGAARNLDVASYQALSLDYQRGLDALTMFDEARAGHEAEHDALSRKCLELQRRGKTLERVMAARRAEAARADERRALRELDAAWLQRPEVA